MPIFGDRSPVLVVDDEPLIAALVADMLEELGCVAAIAENVPEALAKLELDRFDLAILDINLAGRHSFPIAETLSDKNIPFAFASGSSPAIIPDAFRAIPFVRKPFAIEDLSAALALAK